MSGSPSANGPKPPSDLVRFIGPCGGHGMSTIDTANRYYRDRMIQSRQVNVSWRGGTYRCSVKAGPTQTADKLGLNIQIVPLEGARPLTETQLEAIDRGIRARLTEAEKPMHPRVMIDAENGKISIQVPTYPIVAPPVRPAS